MAEFNIEAMSLKELKSLQKDLARAISTFEDRCRVAFKGALPQSVWRTILRTGRFRRDSGDFKEALVARERCFRSKR